MEWPASLSEPLKMDFASSSQLEKAEAFARGFRNRTKMGGEEDLPCWRSRTAGLSSTEPVSGAGSVGEADSDEGEAVRGAGPSDASVSAVGFSFILLLLMALLCLPSPCLHAEEPKVGIGRRGEVRERSERKRGV
ncbi:hypothetical protein MATL_G00174850 [Megalops atlanticus]|uniref:Uncharacterized protein n=1 Tax=Megalops atlanticus TaxID=7932 RepID=A0A9D3PPZ5_MEGAT|nr:hypothetical protein MATL_G00174850 [Megalops atlanticus]